MSLYQKLIWLFIGVAILPLLIFAGVARQQSLVVADFAAEAELVSETAAAGRMLAQEFESAEAALRSLAVLASDGITAEQLVGVMAGGAGPRPEGFRYLAVLGSGGVVEASAGEALDGSACEDGGRSTPIRMEVPIPGGGRRLVAAYRPGRGAGMDVGQGLWVYDGRGELVTASSCEVGPGLPATGLPGDSVAGVVHEDAVARQGSGADEGVVAYARVGVRDWVAVSTGVSLLRAPLARFFRDYWLFVLGLAGITLLAFSILLRQVTGSLDDLTRAVERVSEGDLRPWLPTPRKDEIGRLTLAFSDMTDRLRDLMGQVDRTGRLAVLGKLSAYLAHEIRNPLSSVQMNLQRLDRWRRAGELPEKSGDAIDISLKEVGRLSAAVSNILQLSPGKPQPKEMVAIHDVVSEAAHLLDGDFNRRSVGLRWELNASADRVLGHPGQLKGVIINLMLNALDAQPEGGQLLIESRLRAEPGEEAGPFLELRFRDQGPGVSAELRERIFEPFFTTKEGGSGIGLAVASQTIRDHGGRIFLAERLYLGDGAEFVVSLPLAAVAPEGRLGNVQPQVAPWMDENPGVESS